MKQKLAKLRRKNRREEAETNTRVTNDTVAVHREEVLRGARKFIYPLQHTKHRLVVISVSIFSIALIAFFSYCIVALYKTKSSTDFLYKVTKVVPFPVARIGSDFVAYENYLFEINHYTHYYQTQQDLDFNTEAGQQQLAEFKKRALEKVVNDAYIKKIAKEKNISVSNQEVDDAIRVVRNQNRLGSSDKEFEAVLKDFWGWSVNDFRRSLRQQILTQKVISALDTGTHDRANAALAQLKNGKDFAALAKEVSEDPATKDNGGEYGGPVDQTNRDISPRTIDALFKLQPGQYSEVIDMGYGLEIVKNIENKGSQIRAAHILFNFKDINQYLNEAKDKNKTRAYVSF
jgi:parvulin-like peptidyl-prolyl isomerase